MKLPLDLLNKNEWVIIGPMGPTLDAKLGHLSVIAVDGGAHFSNELTLWIGDADSYNLKPKAEHILILPEHKDASDLSFALNLFQTDSPYTLHLWGFLGGRKDHELFNLGEALNFLEHRPGAVIYFYDEKGEVVFHLLSAGQWTFHHKGIFSVGSLKKISLKITGQCDYQIPHPRQMLPFQSLGLSNQAHGEINIETDGPLFICKIGTEI